MNETKPAAGPDQSRRSFRRRAAALILALGIGVAAMPLLEHVPREQTLVFRLDGEPIRRLEVSWTPRGGDEPAGGVTLTFAERAPRTVRQTVKLPNGEYQLAIEVERDATPRGEGASDATVDPSRRGEETSWVRRVILEGGETIIPLGS